MYSKVTKLNRQVLRVLIVHGRSLVLFFSSLSDTYPVLTFLGGRDILPVLGQCIFIMVGDTRFAVTGWLPRPEPLRYIRQPGNVRDGGTGLFWGANQFISNVDVGI